MKNNLLIALLLSVFMTLSNVMPLNVLAKETTQKNGESSRQNTTIQKTNDTYAIDLSGKGLTNKELWDFFTDKAIDTEYITDLDISGNNLSGKWDFTDFDNLLFLDCSNNQIEDLNVSNNFILRMNCSNNKLKQLNGVNSVATKEDTLSFPTNHFNITNDFSNQNVNIQVKKGVTTITFNDYFPGIEPGKMDITSGQEISQNTNQIFGVNVNQLRYKYQISNNEDVYKRYSLDVNVHIDRTDESSSFTNDPINIADDVANGLVGKQDSSDTESIHRLYNPNSGEHFYTSNTEERDYLVNVGWRSEGVGWVAPTISMAPVYRLYNPNAGDHHYTLDANERNDLQKYGWRYEGISFYSDEYQTVPLYRQYNPNAVAGAHNFTTDKYENDYLISVGWHPEKIGWYALSK